MQRGRRANANKPDTARPEGVADEHGSAATPEVGW